jgi:hypothetical protein
MKKKFASLKSLKKGVGSEVGVEVGSGSISQRYRKTSAPETPYLVLPVVIYGIDYQGFARRNLKQHRAA